MGVQVTDQELETFLNRCNPKVRMQIEQQLLEQDNRHKQVPSQSEQPTPIATTTGVPVSQPKATEVPVKVVKVDDTIPQSKWQVLVQSITQHLWLQIVVVALCVKLIVSLSIAQLLTLAVLYYVCQRWQWLFLPRWLRRHK